MRSLKTMSEGIKLLVKEMAWYCACLLAATILENLDGGGGAEVWVGTV